MITKPKGECRPHAPPCNKAAELYSRLGIAARSSSDLEDVQSVERKGAPHGSVRKFDGLCEKIQSIR